ncbi:MAG: hypothetical protein M0Z84_13535 [Gammaproteobacteria bacterium]|nr:hypothetical protein [Gammaproteobacteria bacterium]
MTERMFRLVFASVLLVGLYFGLRFVVYGLIALSLFRGVAPWRIGNMPARLRPRGRAHSGRDLSALASHPVRMNFEAERAASILAAVTIFCGSFLFAGHLWFLPWFVAFAFFGAGLSGVCPMVLCLKWAGLK